MFYSFYVLLLIFYKIVKEYTNITAVVKQTRESGFVMTMRAVTKIAKGQEITHAYTEPLDPVITRRSILQLGKFFQVFSEHTAMVAPHI